MNNEIIAEIGQNHNGDMNLAKKLIRLAKESGADVAKFQLFNARALFPPASVNPWFDYNCASELSKDNAFRLFDYCNKLEIEFMASVFDVERLEWLEEMGVRRHKIASRSIHDEKRLKAVIGTGKPLLISLGAWKEKEFPKLNVNQEIAYLYCISKYPTPLSDISLSDVNFKEYKGFSDHSLGITAACSSFVLGSKILEKHFTLDKSMYGPDHAGSMTPDELRLINIFRKEWLMCK